jgi:hypothetical protein
VRISALDGAALEAAFLRGSRESRSQFVEYLGNVLPQHLGGPLLEVMGLFDLPPLADSLDTEGTILRLLEEPGSLWVLAGAVYAAMELGMAASIEAVQRLLAHPEPVVRETAIAALARLAERARLAAACEALRGDPDDKVRMLAAAHLQAIAPGEGAGPC